MKRKEGREEGRVDPTRGEMDRSTTGVRNFNISLSSINRIKEKKNCKYTQNLNIISKFNLLDNIKLLHTKVKIHISLEVLNWHILTQRH